MAKIENYKYSIGEAFRDCFYSTLFRTTSANRCGRKEKCSNCSKTLTNRSMLHRSEAEDCRCCSDSLY